DDACVHGSDSRESPNHTAGAGPIQPTLQSGHPFQAVECSMSTPASQAHTATASISAESRPPLRFVTAASLFDGHDAAINIMRRLIQAQGAEVIHLGHNRSVEDVVRAALQEDADAIALSS